MTKYEITLEVTKILEEGVCPVGHKVGDTFKYPEDLGKLCPAAYHSITPYIRIMESGGGFPFFDSANSHQACCPDYLRPVIVKITRNEDIKLIRRNWRKQKILG